MEYLNIPFEKHFVCEFDKYAIQTYNEIHGTNFETSDVTKITAKDLNIVDTDKYDYMLTYSFPCTDLSLAGERKGMGKGSGTRSGLLWEVERLLRECKELPQILVMENVKQVITANGWREWNEFLESLGYKNYCEILNAKDYGIPQNRERAFMVSILGDYSYSFPQKRPLKLRLKDMLEDNVDRKYYLSDKMIQYISADNEKWTGNNDKALINKNIASTINTGEGSRRCDASNYISDDIDEEFDLKENKILINEATKKGYAVATEGDGVYINRPHQKRGCVQKDMIQSLTTHSFGDVGVVVKDNNKGEKNQNLINTLKKATNVNEGDYIDAYNKNVRNDGLSGTILTGVDFRNQYFVAVGDKELTSKRIGGLFDSKKGKHQAGSIWDTKHLAPTLDTMQGGYRQPCIMENKNKLKIRKLTPKECFRLMGVHDKEIDKITCSNAQKYKQAGNSIVVNVLMAIFKQLF